MSNGKVSRWASSGLALNSAWVLGGLLSACGGGQSVDTTSQLSLQLQTPSLSSGSVQVREWRLANQGTSEVAEVFVAVGDEARVRQVRWDCESATAAVRCEVQADGRLRVLNLGAGASVSLQQSVKTEAGLSAELPVDVRVQGGGGIVASSRHSSRWRSFDLAVTAGTPVEELQGETRVQHYEFTLSNAGPDEAVDVRWTQQPLSRMRLLTLSCESAEAGHCPNDMKQQVVLPRVPSGATLRVRASYALLPDAFGRFAEGVWSRAEASGELRTDNNAVVQGREDGQLVAFRATSLSGQRAAVVANLRGSAGMTLSVGDELRTVPAEVDLTGARSEEWTVTTSKGVEQRRLPVSMDSEVLLASHDFGAGREMLVGLGRPIRSLEAVEGVVLNILGTDTESNGQLVSSHAWQGRFMKQQFVLCKADPVGPVEACPVAQRQIYEASVRGDEVELIAGREVIRVQLGQSHQGVMLLRSEPDRDSGRHQFWIGLSYQPSCAPSTGGVMRWGLGNMASDGNAPLGDMVEYGFGDWSEGQAGGVRAEPDFYGFTLPYKLQWQENPASVTLQLASGQLDGLPVPGLVSGELSVADLRTVGPYARGPFSRAGKVWGLLSGCKVVMLGQPGTGLAGRWTLRL